MNYLDKIAAVMQCTAHPDSVPPDEDLPVLATMLIQYETDGG